jgi:hypothetical protein
VRARGAGGRQRVRSRPPALGALCCAGARAGRPPAGAPQRQRACSRRQVQAQPGVGAVG